MEENRKVKKTFLSMFMALVLLMAGGTAAIADGAPAAGASCLAHCAVTMGGQHVAESAQTMEQGVSTCAQMSSG